MTPQQKLMWAVVKKASHWADRPIPPYPCHNIEEYYDDLSDTCYSEFSEAKEEIRRGEVETHLPSFGSRYYESKSVSMEFPDGSWVGWIYWYGGGKYGEPETVDWMDDAYDLDCHQEEKMVVVRTFKKTATKILQHGLYGTLGNHEN